MGCKAEAEAQSLILHHHLDAQRHPEPSFAECRMNQQAQRTSLLPVQPALGPKAQRHTGWQEILKLSLLPELLLLITHSGSLLYHALQISSQAAGTPE